jgi:hypothetical protein
LKVTVPEVTGEVEPDTTTLAVKVTGWLWVEGSNEEVRVVVVALVTTLFTT